MSFLIGTLSFVLLSVSLFMILLVLIQRGRGGGLAGAFGGMGGQSAFGTRAGDTFTRITIVLAVIWVLLAGGIGMLMRRDAEASRTGENSEYLGGGKANEKNDDLTTEGDAKSDSEKSGESAADKDGDKSKAIGTTPPDVKKSDDAAPAKAESGEAGKTAPDEKSTPPAEAPEKDAAAKDAPASDTKATDEKATDEKATDEKATDEKAADGKATLEKSVEPEASKEAPAEPTGPGEAPPASNPNP